MVYLDAIPLKRGESLPPGYSLVKAGVKDSKIAVATPQLVGTYGRWPKADRALAISSAWRSFGYTREEWDKVCDAAIKAGLDELLLRKMQPMRG